MAVFREISLDKWQWSPSPLPGQVVLVTSRDEDGASDVAPKSWVTIVGMTVPRIGFGCTFEHQTARNIRATGEFAISIPDESLAQAVWGMQDATDRSDRLAAAGLTTTPGVTVGVPLVTECYAHIECRLDRIVEFEAQEVFIVGVIQRVAVDERALVLGEVFDRYAAARPFFFLEDGWLASLGPARPVLTSASGREGSAP